MHLLGLIIVSWIVVRLLVIERLPYKLDDTITPLQIWVIVMLLLTSLLEIKILIDKLYHKEKSSYIKRFFSQYLTKYYVLPLETLQERLL
jgi:hypothetical protein